MYNIYDQIFCCVGGTQRTAENSVDCQMERNNSQLGRELTEDGSTTTAAMAAITNTKHKPEMEDRTNSLICGNNMSVYTKFPVKYTRTEMR